MIKKMFLGYYLNTLLCSTFLQALQRSGNGQTLEEVLSEMFRVISSPTEDFRPAPSRCRTCAVVGNSGKLRQSDNGKEIDSHDSVIRYVRPQRTSHPVTRFPIFLSFIMPLLSSSSSSSSVG